MITIIVFSDWGYWGKGTTLNEACKNAKVLSNPRGKKQKHDSFRRKGHTILVFAVTANPEDVSVNDMGGISHPTDAVVHDLTGGTPIKL